MKKRILLISLLTTAVALLVFFVVSAEAYYRSGLEDGSFGELLLRALPTLLVAIAVELLLCVLVTYLATGYILRPLENLTRDAARRKRVEIHCSELQPIAALINQMQDDATARVREIDEEKNLVLKAQASKNEFIANITHEMNTPLTSIKGFAELLASGQLSAEQERKAANTVLAQSERLTSLVACIINYNEIDSEELPLYEVNASRIAQELLDSLAPSAAEHKVSLTGKIAEDVTLTSRHERVTEIFGNLIRNAIRYNKEGGSVRVKLTGEEFVVSDTGIGIAEENLDRIFDRFFTVDKSHGGKNGGFGLGLAVVKKLCKKAGWELRVESSLGIGTQFTIRFL